MISIDAFSDEIIKIASANDDGFMKVALTRYMRAIEEAGGRAIKGLPKQFPLGGMRYGAERKAGRAISNAAELAAHRSGFGKGTAASRMKRIAEKNPHLKITPDEAKAYGKGMSDSMRDADVRAARKVQQKIEGRFTGD
jgi:hypothetical protein